MRSEPRDRTVRPAPDGPSRRPRPRLPRHSRHRIGPRRLGLLEFLLLALIALSVAITIAMAVIDPSA
jgi:hypothetical protein